MMVILSHLAFIGRSQRVNRLTSLLKAGRPVDIQTTTIDVTALKAKGNVKFMLASDCPGINHHDNQLKEIFTPLEEVVPKTGFRVLRRASKKIMKFSTNQQIQMRIKDKHRNLDKDDGSYLV